MWRFYTVPAAEDKAEHAQKAMKSWAGQSWLTGGGSAWVTGTYDPDLNTLYWGIGNPSPDFNGEVREGDNLYTCSIVALNPDDGTLQMAFPEQPPRPVGLRRREYARAGRHQEGGQDRQGARPGPPQRLLLLHQSRERRISFTESRSAK